MPIPPLTVAGELPPGEHDAALDEVDARFGSGNPQRMKLMSGLRKAAENLAGAGVPKIWVDGSFVTDKEHPNDIDGVWDTTSSVDLAKLDPVFLDRREAMKGKYSLDFFPNVIEGGSGKPFPAFFQTNRAGEPKGIVVIRLDAEP